MTGYLLSLRTSRSLGLVVACLGCAPEDDTRASSLWLETGHETDIWTADPAPVEVTLTQTLTDGSEMLIGTYDPPAPDETLRIPLGGVAPGWFEVEGLDSAGEVQVRAISEFLDPAAAFGLPLRVFTGRVGHFNRPPSELLDAQGVSPPIALLADRYVLMAGTPYLDDAAVRLDGYDLPGLAITAFTLVPCPERGCQTRSLVAMSDGLAIMLGDDWGVWADFACGSDCTGSVALPDALDAFGDLAGGDTIVGEDGTRIIVGATRSNEPSRAILMFHPDDWQAAYLHETPRVGASATWVRGSGLLVVGGTTEGSGAELWSASEASFTELPYPPDPTCGAALVAFDGRHVLRVGGLEENEDYAPSVVYDLECTNDCLPVPFGPPIELDNVQAFRVKDAVLCFGTDSEGLNQARRITADSVETVHLRETRRGAKAIQTPLSQVMVIGGSLENGDPALTLELYQP